MPKTSAKRGAKSASPPRPARAAPKPVHHTPLFDALPVDREEILRGLAQERKLWQLLGIDRHQLSDYARRGAEADAAILDGVQTLCLFIGYPRSGHSLVGSLLDAHPEMAIAHELDALLHLAQGLRPRQILYLMLELSRLHAALGRRWGDYEYAVPGQWQGRVSTLRILGDKKGRMTTLRIARDPTLLTEVMTRFEPRKRFVHVVRDPYDNIAAIALKGRPLAEAIEEYFLLHRTNRAIIKRVGAQAVATVYHEDLVANPKAELKRLCGFLGVDTPAGYLDACASIVYGAPHRSRDLIDWPSRSHAEIARRLARHPMLTRYRSAS